tara:strand:+ start:151 stop:780 length:630 start_codon:yes stop_codon:yes gene_type:complete
MTMFRSVSLVAAITIGSSSPAIGVQTATREAVSEAFAHAVTDYCMPAVMQGDALADLSAPSDSQGIEQASASRSRGGAPGTVWVISGLGEIVALTMSDPNTCSVDAYGPPVDATFDRIAADIASVHAGFVEIDTGRQADRRQFVRRIEGELDGRHYTVSMRGNEPGARGTMSRFSTLMATVSVSGPDTGEAGAAPVEPDTDAAQAEGKP